MNKLHETFGLRCPDGREAQLLSVQVHGEILGLMLRLTVRQVWRNASGAPMATRLHFPLAWDQTLLDLQLQRAQGPQTLDKVWRDSRHGCSATPGVLATGEQVTLQWRIGQLLSLQGSSLRLQLPAGLIPRAPHPAQISLEVLDPVAQGTVSCTSHDMQRVRHANGVSLSLHAPSGLDHDLVLTVHGLRDSGFALVSPDLSAPGDCTVLMSACPRLHREGTGQDSPLRMKLLVDSSSTMPAERLSQIRSALDKLLAQCQPEDQLSYSRFGERTVHELPRLQVCTEAYQRRVRALARHTDTDMGHPDPLAALLATLAIPDENEDTVTQADILLITASPLWAIDAPLRALRAAGHRLHVMAVGDAGESLWRELAEASGGAFELLGPGQHSQQTLARLIERLRQLHPVQARLNIEDAQLLTTSERDADMADGDTLHLWAQIRPDTAAQDLTGRPDLHIALHWHTDPATPQTLPAAAVLWDDQGDLTRLCAARELAQDSDEQALQRIRQYGLIVPDTSRLAASATPPTPATASTPAPMSAAKPGVPASERPSVQPAAAPVPLAMRTLRGVAPRHTDLAGWLGEPGAPGNPLTALVAAFNAQAGAYSQFRAALSGTLQGATAPWLNGLVLQLARRAGNPGRVWAMLLHWLHAEHDMPLSAKALQLLELELASVPVALRTEVHTALAEAAIPVAARQAA